MSHASLALQGAVYTALTAASPGLGVPVYDHVPQDTPAPYVQIGDGTAINGGDKTRHGMEHTVTLHFASAYDGHKQLKEMMAAAYAALHEQALSVTGQDLVIARFEFETTYPEPDGERRRGVQRYRMVTRSQS